MRNYISILKISVAKRAKKFKPMNETSLWVTAVQSQVTGQLPVAHTFLFENAYTQNNRVDGWKVLASSQKYMRERLRVSLRNNWAPLELPALEDV